MLMFVFASMGLAFADYDTAHQIIYTKQMVKADMKKLVYFNGRLINDMLALTTAQNQQQNEQLTYERLISQEEIAQDQFDNAQTPSEKDKMKKERDRIYTALKYTRTWLAAHELDVVKASLLAQKDQNQITVLDQEILRFNQILINDGALIKM